jgi:hypothetical protein
MVAAFVLVILQKHLGLALISSCWVVCCRVTKSVMVI